MVEEMIPLAKGAEADLYRVQFSSIFFPTDLFREVILKIRVPKGYRVPQLDRQIRRQRTISEAKIIRDSRSAGANVPLVLGAWVEKCILVIEWIEGTRLKEYLAGRGPERVEACRQAGEQLALLHRGGIVHGDPTTSNMILSDGRVYLIDFGLAEYSDSLEKRAVDLHLIKTAIRSTHYSSSARYFSALVDGYASLMGDQAPEILGRSKAIEKRGRYVER
jgi:TP53 regulating kinase-like protein